MCRGNFDLLSHLFGDLRFSWLIFYLFLCVSFALQCGKPVSGYIVLGFVVSQQIMVGGCDGGNFTHGKNADRTSQVITLTSTDCLSSNSTTYIMIL